MIKRFGRWVAQVLLVAVLASVWMGAPAAAAGEAAVQVTQHAQLGAILTDANGMTLYRFAKDEQNVSNCYGDCEQKWPPLLAQDGAAPGAPADLTGALGTTVRKDGKVQVTYNGMPLYYWFADKKPGDTLGQGVNGVWFVVNPPAAVVKVAEHPDFGSLLTGPNGLTLYVFTMDKPGESTCYGACEALWPPLVVEPGTRPVAAGGLTASLGTTARKDGRIQVTYNGMPLYYWASDKQPGDTLGHKFREVWFVAHPGLMADNAGHWADQDVTLAVKQGWVKGNPDGTFRPNGTVTRAEFVVMLARAFGLPEAPAAGAFQDTPAHWAGSVIDSAVQAGIIMPEEYAGALFQPDRPITRLEIAVMVVRALALPATEQGYLAAAVEHKVVGGYPDGSLRPEATATRAETVVMIHRALKAR